MQRSVFKFNFFRIFFLFTLLLCFSFFGQINLIFAADSNKLYGIHWWGFSGSLPIDNTPASLLDSVTESAWDTETIVVKSDFWWQAPFFKPLYQELYTNKNVSIITRIDYQWGQTVPTSADSAIYPTLVVDSVVNVLKDYCHIWIIGNEMNLTSEANGFPDNKITPEYYVQIYKAVRNAIHSRASTGAPGQHIVLLGPVSPGPVDGPRWKSGTEYLDEMLSLLTPDEVDGFAIHAYGGSLSDFQSNYRSQLAVIDARGFHNKPVYMTEWNKHTPVSGGYSAESATAKFIREAFADVHSWNTTYGNHNIICMTWFVYDADNQAGGGWNDYAIEYWKNVYYPYGNPNDIYTAFEETVDLRYSAGSVGGGLPPSVTPLPYKDEFEGPQLKPFWTINNPDDPSVTTSEDTVRVVNGYLEIFSNGYDDDLWTSRNAAPFVWIRAPNYSTWTIETYLTVPGGIPAGHKAGIWITTDTTNTLNSFQITMQRDLPGSWATGVIASYFINGTHRWVGYDSNASLSAAAFQIIKSGNQFTVRYKPTGVGNWLLLPPDNLWQPQNPFTFPALANQPYVGLFAGSWPNDGSSGSFIAKFDYFGTSWDPGFTEVEKEHWFLYK